MKMDTFGVTAHGVPRELAFASCPKYEEPRQQACRRRGCPERWLDPDLLRADGQYLGSYWRYSLQHNAAVRRPTGPHDRFRFPVTTAMDIGWSLVDPALIGAHFLCTDRRSPLVQSDIFRMWDEQMLHAGDDLSLRTRKPLDLAELTPKLRCVELPEHTSDSAIDKQQSASRDEHMLEGIKLSATHNSLERIDSAERQRQMEMQRREERQKRRAQMEGSHILRETMEMMRHRKDMQPPLHARPKEVEEPEQPTWRPPIIIPATETHLLPGQVMLHGTKKVLFSELLPHRSDSITEALEARGRPAKQVSGQAQLAYMRQEYPLGAYITGTAPRDKQLKAVPPIPLYTSDSTKDDYRALPLVRGVPRHIPGQARCDPIRDTSTQGYTSSLGVPPLDPTPKRKLAMLRQEIRRHARKHSHKWEDPKPKAMPMQPILVTTTPGPRMSKGKHSHFK